MARLLISLSFLVMIASVYSQPNLYRHYPQSQTYYFNCEMKTAVKTSDGGYLLGFCPWAPGLHNFNTVATYLIKTDSSFIPQWKKPYFASSIQLPTGGILLIHGSTVEKLTASGAVIWVKTLSDNSLKLNDGVNYGNRVRIVGRKVGGFFYPGTNLHQATSQAYTLLMDTSGNIISQSLFDNSMINSPYPFNISYMGNADFSKLKRDAQGNFYVFSTPTELVFSVTDMSIAKFDSSFSFLWAKTWSSPYNKLLISDLDILPSGNIIATGLSSGVGGPLYPQIGTFVKLSAQGSIISQKFFENCKKISGLCKKANGNYISSAQRGDSLFIFEIDTALNFMWNKHFGTGLSSGTPIIKGNTLFTPFFYGSDPVVRSHDLSGNSCSSYSAGYSLPTASVGLSSFTFSSVISSATISSGTTSSLSSQSYVDSCKCPVSIPLNQSQLCVGSVGTVAIIGNGPLSWYSSATGNTFIQSNPQYTFSSNTPTSLTIYAQDSTCAAFPVRTPVTINVYSQPTLAFSPNNPTICIGTNVFVALSGANNYTWSGNFNSPTSYVQNLNPTVTTIYTINAANAPGCTDSKTVGVFVVPPPTLTVNSPTVCTGTAATLSVSGAVSYSWAGLGSNSPTVSVTPTAPAQYFYSVTGSIGSCAAYKQATVTVVPIPTISISGSPTVCSGEQTTLTATGASNYTWSTNTIGNNLVISPLNTSTYSVLGTSGSGCYDSATLIVSTVPVPTLIVSSSAYSVCEESTVSINVSGANNYLWSNGISSNSFTSVVHYGNTLFTVAGSNGSCSSTASILLNGAIVPTIGLNISPYPSVLCLGGTYTITPFKYGISGPSSYTFENLTIASQTIITALSDFELIVTGANGGCYRTDTFNLQVFPNPTISVAQSQNTICSGQSFIALVTGANYCNWNDLYIPTVNVATFSPNMSTSYYVIGYNAHGCTDTAHFDIDVHYAPSITLHSNSSVICSGETTTLSASGAQSYSWSTSQSGASIVVAPTTSSIFTVVGTSTSGCSNTATVMQLVDLCSGTKETSPDLSIRVFPNPGTSKFHVTVPQNDGELIWKVFGSLGELVRADETNNAEFIIDLSENAVGVYYLTITSKQTSVVQKILKE